MKPLVLPQTVVLFVLLVSRQGHALETVLRYPAVTQRNLNTVCWTGSQFVAAGEYGVVSRSPDGVTWTSAELPESPELLTSAAGAGRVVVAGEKSLLFSSADGVNWTREVVPAQDPLFTHISDLAFNGTVFRATSYDSNTNWSSTDGQVWTKLQSSAATFRMAINGSEFLSWPSSAGSGSPQILLRDAGSGWTNTTTNLTQAMKSLVWTGVRYVSVGKSGAAATSTDGTTWTDRTTSVNKDLSHVVWTGSQAVAVGAGGTIITSPNGATWTAKHSATTADLTDIAWSGSAAVAVGKRGVILRSADGNGWSVVKTAAPLVNVAGVGWTGTSAVAVGPEGTLTSSDGISWTRTTATPGPRNQDFRIAAGAGHLVATDSTGLWTALLDASFWVNSMPATIPDPFIPPFSGASSVQWDGQQFVALIYAPNRQMNQTLFSTVYSSDGVIWSAPRGQGFTFPSYEPGFVNDLLFTGSAWLSSKWRSTDGRVWTSDTKIPDSTFFFRTPEGILSVQRYGGVVHVFDGSWSNSVAYSPQIVYPLDAVVWTGSRLLGTFVGPNDSQGIREGGPGRPWTKIHLVGGVSMAWTGTRAIVATGNSLFTVENLESTLPLTWATWRQQYFTAAQLDDAAVSGPLADPDRDGSANLVEYMTATSPVSRVATPVFTVLPAQGNQSLRFQWRQDTGRTDISVHVELSNDLDVWDEVTSVPVDGTAGGIRLMEASAPPNQKEFYFRLKVVLNA